MIKELYCETVFLNSRFDVQKLIYIIYFFSLVTLQASLNAIDSSNNYAWFISVVVWFSGFFLIRNSLPVVIVFIFCFSYVTVPYYHFISLKQISFYSDFQRVDLINQVSLLNTLFFATLSLVLANVSDKNLQAPSTWVRSNQMLFYISLIPCFYSLVFGLSGESILSSGYGDADAVVNKSPLHEYFIGFFIFPLLFMNKNNHIQKFTILLMLMLYSGKTLIYGGRIEVIQSGLVYCYIVFNYLKSFSRFKLYLLAASFILVMFVVGAIRGSLFQIIAAENIYSLINIVFTSDNSSPYVMTTSTEVYYASMRLLGMLDDGLLSFEVRVYSFTSFLFNIFFTFSDFKTNANLASFHSDQFRVGGGGLLPTYFYVWSGYIGVIFSALFIGKVISLVHGKCHFVFRVYGFMLLVTFPRWWAYSPINLTKFCIYTVIFYLLYLSISPFINKKYVGNHGWK